jgi:apolipoprotein N-acyltransferase
VRDKTNPRVRVSRRVKPSRRAWLVAWSLTLAGGAAGWAAFPPLGWWPMAMVSTALLFAATRLLTPWRAFTVALGYGFVMFLPLLWWAKFAAGVVPWVILSAACAVLLGLAAPTWRYAAKLVQPKAWCLQPLLFAVLFTAADTFRGYFPFNGFPWVRFCFSQADSPLARLARLGGAPLITFAAALAGALLVSAGDQFVRRGRVTWAKGAVALALAAGIIILPAAIPLPTAAQSGTLLVAGVQGDVAVTEEGLFAHQREVLQNHVDGTLALAAAGVQPDVVLWPENSTDIDPETNQEAWDAIDGAAQAIDAPILVGSIQYTETGQRYNLGVVWEPGVGITDRYAKQHPAPWAEYIPMRSFSRLFSKKVDLIQHDMLPGTKPAVLALPVERLGRSVTLGDVICFEVADDAVVTGSIANGAEILVIQTNNASFGHTSESTQQLAMSRLRAIEYGRATVQVSTVGISAVIAPDGTVLEQTGLFEAAQFTAELPLRTSKTPAVWLARPVAVGFMLVGLALALAGIGAGVVARRRGSSRS